MRLHISYGFLLLHSCFYEGSTSGFFRDKLHTWLFSIPLSFRQLPHCVFKGWASMGCIFVCPNNGIAASTWEFYMHIDADVPDCAQGLCKHCKRVCTECWLWEKNLLLHIIFQPALVACQTWCSTNRTFILAPLLFLIVHNASLQSLIQQWQVEFRHSTNTKHVAPWVAASKRQLTDKRNQTRMQAMDREKTK